MNKLAVFVEGLTEQLFVDKLITEIAGEKNVRIERRKVWGGSTVRRRMKLLEAIGKDSGQQYYVLIVDCGGDEQVKSRIVEEYDSLARAGYKLVIGLRDIHPIKRADIPKLRMRLPLKVKTKPIPVIFILSVMEIEAWFLSEHTHFSRLGTPIDAAKIQAWCGFDPSSDDMELRDTPALDMACVYYLAGEEYRKDAAVLQGTIDLLDFSRIYFHLPEKHPELKKMVEQIDGFLAHA